MYAVQKDGAGVFRVHAFGAANLKPAGVKTRKSRIKREDNGFAVGAFDHGRHHVALRKRVICNVVIVALFALEELVQTCRTGRGRGQ